MMSLPVVCCYGPNNCGKSDRLLVYSACCGVLGGKNKSESDSNIIYHTNMQKYAFVCILVLHLMILESTDKAAVEMMAEKGLTFLPLDDPVKKVIFFFSQTFKTQI